MIKHYKCKLNLVEMEEEIAKKGRAQWKEGWDGADKQWKILLDKNQNKYCLDQSLILEIRGKPDVSGSAVREALESLSGEAALIQPRCA